MIRRPSYAVAIPIAAMILLHCASLQACSVPVYRYALERWPSDAYRVVVFHRGALSAEHQSLVKDLGPYGLAGAKKANIVTKTVDLAASPDKDMLALWQSLQGKKPQLPYMVVRYPDVADYAPAWSGPLTRAAVDSLVDSPVRQEIAKRILSGETTVWLLLESGNKAKDDAAYAALKKQLAIEEQTLKLPPIDDADIAGAAAKDEIAKLRIKFSIIRVSRDDPKERMVVEMLLGSEGSGRDSLRDPEYVKQIMAFPIFGRGRIRYGLVGEGIAEDTIHEACAYLTGPCKCQIKTGVENRGMDLVMGVDWDRIVTSTIKDKPAPPLLGLGGLKTGDDTEPIVEPVAAKKPTTESQPIAGAAAQQPATAATGKPTVMSVVEQKPETSGETSRSETAAGGNPLSRNLFIVLGIAVVVILGGSVFLVSRNG